MRVWDARCDRRDHDVRRRGHHRDRLHYLGRRDYDRRLQPDRRAASAAHQSAVAFQEGRGARISNACRQPRRQVASQTDGTALLCRILICVTWVIFGPVGRVRLWRSGRIGVVPELPEVETVRRMLEPAMHRAKFRRVIVNRPNLRIPFPDRFADRLRGTTVEAVQRRGKYLVVSLSSGEALIMHLGMSGWFHVAADWRPHARGRCARSRRVRDVVGAERGVQRPAALWLHGSVGRQPADYPSLKAMGPEPLSAEFTRGIAGARVPRQEGRDQGDAARSEGRRRARQHLRERSLASRAHLAAP